MGKFPALNERSELAANGAGRSGMNGRRRSGVGKGVTLPSLPPSEPDMKVSLHPAQAVAKLRMNGAGFTTV